MEWQPIYLTLKLALATTLVLLVVGIPLVGGDGNRDFGTRPVATAGAATTSTTALVGRTLLLALAVSAASFLW